MELQTLAAAVCSDGSGHPLQPDDMAGRMVAGRWSLLVTHTGLWGENAPAQSCTRGLPHHVPQFKEHGTRTTQERSRQFYNEFFLY